MFCVIVLKPNPVVVRSKKSICGGLIAEAAGSNHAGYFSIGVVR